MYTVNDLKKLIKRVEEEQQSLLRIGCDEKKEYGRPKDDTCMRYNCIMIAVDRAYIALQKELDYKI